MHKFLFAIPLVALTACIGEDKDAKLGSTSCDEAAFEFLAGQNKDAVADIITPEKVRVAEDESPMTMDHLPDRLNVIHDADGVVIKVWCG